MSIPMLASMSSLVVFALPFLVTNIENPVPPGLAVFVVLLGRPPTKTAEPEERGRTESDGGWQGAVSAKLDLVLCLARNRCLPKRPPEPRPSGIHPEEDAVKKRRAASLYALQ